MNQIQEKAFKSFSFSHGHLRKFDHILILEYFSRKQLSLLGVLLNDIYIYFS